MLRRLAIRARCVCVLAAGALGVVSIAHAQCESQWMPGDGVTGSDPHVYAATSWDPDGAGPLPTYTVIGGSFHAAGVVFTSGVAMWTNGSWISPATGVDTDGVVRALAARNGGELYVAGTFSAAGSVGASNIARFDGTSWRSLGSGVNGDVNALVLMSNGDLVAGGNFTTAGGVACSNIARWNAASQTWSPLGAGTNATVYALTALPSGDIVAGGVFVTAGGVGANNIARFDGASWSALGAGMNGGVRSLTTLASGDLVAGGYFTAAGGVAASHVARWNGTSWNTMGNGLSDSVEAFCTMPNGDVVAGGFFIDSNLLIRRIARWTGTAWAAYGSGTAGPVRCLTPLGTSTLVAGGDFTSGYVGSGTTLLNYVGSWSTTSSSWSSMTVATTSTVWVVKALPNGDALVAGQFNSIGGVSARKIARWSAATGAWSQFGTTPPISLSYSVQCVDIGPGGVDSDVVVGGNFEPIGTFTPSCVARWNGTTWSDMGGGVTLDPTFGDTPIVYAATHMPNGDVVVGGTFDTAGGVPASNIARWNGTAWSALGSGTDFNVHALAVLPSGDLVAGGSFTVAGGVSVDSIARWNGVSWSAMGPGAGGPGGYVSAFAFTPAGELVSAGGTWPNSKVARWTGSAWVSYGSPACRPATCIEIKPSGEMIVGGGMNFGTGGSSSVQRYTGGTVWTTLGFGAGDYVDAIATMANGELWAGGPFNSMDLRSTRKLARWVTPRAPSITAPPAPARVCASGSASFGVTASVNTTVAYRWEIQAGADAWIPLTSSPTPLPCGGAASASPPGTPLTSITLIACPGSTPYSVRCVATNVCGSAASAPAAITVCRADFDCSGTLTPPDIFDFLAAFFALDPRADFNGSGAADVQDIFDFLSAWFAGC